MRTDPPALLTLNDTFWPRLPVTLPLAVILCLLGLQLLTQWLAPPAKKIPPPIPVDAQIIELPAAHEAHAGPPPAPVAKPIPVVPRTLRLPEPSPPPLPHSETPTPAAPPSSTPTASSPPVNAPASTPAPPSASPPLPPTPSNVPPAGPHGQGASEVRAARALVHPLPVIPDELRASALKEVALVRFHISKDGTVTVELLHPTQTPRLNRLLLETLQQWRFFPAIKNGHPVDSVQDLSLKISVQ
ncbi:TonB family protein [Ferrovum sp.]|uniref:energy transducer TonB n=1 Tax=Ferrovum sp. TaxID=2609467 RepID=UPI0026286B53|nr:TonB family protein [Ferrovum sp.]